MKCSASARSRKSSARTCTTSPTSSSSVTAPRRDARQGDMTRPKGASPGKRQEQTMVDVLKSGERNVVERVVAKALNRRALLTKSMLVAGAWSAGAGFDAAKDAEKRAQAVEGGLDGH